MLNIETSSIGVAHYDLNVEPDISQGSPLPVPNPSLPAPYSRQTTIIFLASPRLDLPQGNHPLSARLKFPAC